MFDTTKKFQTSILQRNHLVEENELAWSCDERAFR